MLIALHVQAQLNMIAFNVKIISSYTHHPVYQLAQTNSLVIHQPISALHVIRLAPNAVEQHITPAQNASLAGSFSTLNA